MAVPAAGIRQSTVINAPVDLPRAWTASLPGEHVPGQLWACQARLKVMGSLERGASAGRWNEAPRPPKTRPPETTRSAVDAVPATGCGWWPPCAGEAEWRRHADRGDTRVADHADCDGGTFERRAPR